MLMYIILFTHNQAELYSITVCDGKMYFKLKYFSQRIPMHMKWSNYRCLPSFLVPSHLVQWPSWYMLIYLVCHLSMQVCSLIFQSQDFFLGLIYLLPSIFLWINICSRLYSGHHFRSSECAVSLSLHLFTLCFCVFSIFHTLSFFIELIFVVLWSHILKPWRIFVFLDFVLTQQCWSHNRQFSTV